MAHIRIVETEDGFFNTTGVEDALETTNAPQTGKEQGQEQFGDPESNATPSAAKEEPKEEVLVVSEETDTPPQQPEDHQQDASFVCDAEGCGKVCSSKAGLIAHQRSKHKE